MSVPTALRPRLRRALPLLGMVVGLWALLPPYTGPHLNTEMRVEVADHVVPAVVLLLASAVAFLASRRPIGPPSTGLVCGLLVVLSGIWMTTTHVPLVAQASRDEVTTGAAAYHTAPGLVVLALGLVWVALTWDEASPPKGVARSARRR